MKKSLLILLVGILSSIWLPERAGAADFHPMRLVIRFNETQSSTALRDLVRRSGANKIGKLFPTTSTALSGGDWKPEIFVAEFPDSVACERGREQLSSEPGVHYVERDYLMQMFSDPLAGNQWGLKNEGQEYFGIVRVPGVSNDSLKLMTGKPGADIGRAAALVVAHDRTRVKVAIIDTGVDYDHPDLEANIWHNFPELNGRTGFDDDHNGYVDDVVGYDFSGDDGTGFQVSPDSDPMDTIGHGTHCAGIVGAVSGNGIGIEGIAPNVEIMCLKIFPNALATASAEAIVYATEHGAKVINASWGSPYYSSILNDAITYAVDNGVLFVVASGNTGTSAPLYPARLDQVLTVGATNSSDQVTYFSTYGNWLDLCAPGQDILSLRAHNTDLYAEGGEPLLRIIDGEYYLADGTSMAAPHVVGSAALLLSIAPGLPADSLRNLMLNTADRVADPDGTLPASYSNYGGWGRVNVGRAAGLLSEEYAEIESPRANEISGGTIPFSGSAYSATGESFLLEARPASTGEWLTIATGSAELVRESITEWDSSPFDGVTQLRLRVGTKIGYTSNVRLVNSQVVELLSPAEGDTVYSAAEVVGSASMPQFQSYDLYYYSDVQPKNKILILRSNELLYRSTLANWTVGQIAPGSGTLELVVNGTGDPVTVRHHIVVKSAIADNFPVDPGQRPHFCSVAGDIDGDGKPELLTGARHGIIVNNLQDNTVRTIAGAGGSSFESALALYDFDGDGADEIVGVTESGVTILDGAGQVRSGWPKAVNTGNQFNAYPTPLVSDIDGDQQMEILFVNSAGEIYCWHADGSSYFRSQNGLFARIENHGLARTFGGSYVAFIFAYDFDGDGYQDIGTLYDAIGTSGGIFMYSGKNGAPLYRDRGARVFAQDDLFGGVVADFDGDGDPEIGFCHWYSEFLAMGVRIIEADGSDLPGWPKLFPEKTNYLTPYPAAADLDHDSLPELICTFSALDGGEVYIWHGDGSPFLSLDFGRADGFFAGTTNSLSNPIILDVDNDGEWEIVSRGGALLVGKQERLFAWNLDGSIVNGWPIYTYADPATVIYTTYTPVAGDFDGDGLLELFMGSSDGRLYAWNLPTPATPGAVAWGNFLRDNRHSATLPFVARPAPPPPALPSAFRLGQNFPNPFNLSTIIEIDLPETGKAKLEVLNILGQHVATLAEVNLEAGYHRFSWDGKDNNGKNLASGVYFYRLRMEDFEQTRRMVLLK